MRGVAAFCLFAAPWALIAAAQLSAIEGGPAETRRLVLEGAGGERTELRVEVARTPAARARGLQGRADLNGVSGMLFCYPDAAMRAFWMKDTPLALEILFLDADGRVAERARGVPFSEDVLRSAVPVRAVLEVPARRAEALGAEVGARLSAPDGELCDPPA